MNKFSQQKLLDIPSEIVHNHEKSEHAESQIVKTTEGSRINAEVGGEKSNKDFETETNHSLVADPVPGCPNFRRVPGYKVYCCGQPTIAGFEAALNKVCGYLPKGWEDYLAQPVPGANSIYQRRANLCKPS